VTVQLTVTDSLGSSATSSATITVTSPISGSGGGGGGALALWWQCGLLALGLLLRRRSA